MCGRREIFLQYFTVGFDLIYFIIIVNRQTEIEFSSFICCQFSDQRTTFTYFPYPTSVFRLVGRSDFLCPLQFQIFMMCVSFYCYQIGTSPAAALSLSLLQSPLILLPRPFLPYSEYVYCIIYCDRSRV